LTRMLALVLDDHLTPEDQRLKLARGDPALREPRREEATAMDLPTVPAVPGDEASENRQKAHGAGVGVALGEPPPIGPQGNTAGRGRPGFAEPAACLELP
jgi:hypothetical protein